MKSKRLPFTLIHWMWRLIERLTLAVSRVLVLSRRWFIMRRRPSRWRTIENNVCLQLIGKIIFYIYSSLYIIKSYARWNGSRSEQGKQQNNIGTMKEIGETAYRFHNNHHTKYKSKFDWTTEIIRNLIHFFKLWNWKKINRCSARSRLEWFNHFRNYTRVECRLVVSRPLEYFQWIGREWCRDVRTS